MFSQGEHVIRKAQDTCSNIKSAVGSIYLTAHPKRLIHKRQSEWYVKTNFTIFNKPWQKNKGYIKLGEKLKVTLKEFMYLHMHARTMCIFTFVFIYTFVAVWGFSSGSDGRESACNAGDLGSTPGWERSPGGGNGIYSNILAWSVPWAEEPGSYSPWGGRVRHDWATNTLVWSLSYIWL